MTVEQILAELRPEKPVSRKTVYQYLTKCGIRPIGELRQRPQRYPDDAATIIRSKLGLSTHKRSRR